MDAHYEAQIARNQENFLTHGGPPARQFGSGAAGLGALAVRIGRCTLPLLQKYALPIAKKMGRNLITAAIPEIGQMMAAKKKQKSAAKDSLKKSVSKTISESTTADRSCPPAETVAIDASVWRTRSAGYRAGRSPGGGAQLNPKPLINKQTRDKRDTITQEASQNNFEDNQDETQSIRYFVKCKILND